MENFFQAAGGVLVTIVLSQLLSNQNKSWASLLSMGVCAMVLFLGVMYLEPVIHFLAELERLGNLQSDLVKILLKAAGIGILTEITAMLCADSGNNSLAQSIRTLSAGLILCLSLPVFQALLSLIQEILEGI